MELWQLSAVEMVRGMAEGAFSSEEIVRSVADRVRAENGALNAIVYDYCDAAIEQAREADEARARGDELGTLHGVPVTVKVNVDVEGTPNTNGLPAFADNISPGHSPVVSNRMSARNPASATTLTMGSWFLRRRSSARM